MEETAMTSSSSPPSSSEEIPSTSSITPSDCQSGSPVEEVGEQEASVLTRPQRSSLYRVGHTPTVSAPPVEEMPSDDTLSCVIVILTFWFFVSMTLIMGIFGSEDLRLGPYSSILLQPNPFFVHYLKVETLKEAEVAPVLYGFYKPPPLDVIKTWSESLSASIKTDSHKEWVYYLNEGSLINISYNVRSSSSLVLIVAKGFEEMAQWLEDPLYPNNDVSWNVVRGSGTIRQDILKSYDYYVAVGNFNSEDVEVELNFLIKSTMYDTTESYYKCNLTQSLCNLNILFPWGNAAVLTTPGPQEGAESYKLHIKLSYEPRWLTYFLGIGGMTSIMLWAFSFLNRIRRSSEDRTENQSESPERAPLLSQKEDDLSSLGSSYDSGSQNDEEQEYLEEGLLEGRPIGEGGKKFNPRQLCVICFDAPRDCFFIPCGHCASCFTCATRIAEAAGTCPICRRKMKKVRRMYTV